MRLISDEEADELRLTVTFNEALCQPNLLEIEQLKRQSEGQSQFEKCWFENRATMAELGAQIMTISEERLAKWRSQRDPTYVAPTSFRVLVVA